MSTSLAQGTWTRIRVAAPPAPADLPDDAAVAAMGAAEKVDRLLAPQHAALRTAVTVLRRVALQLARLEPTCAAPLCRVAAIAEELDAAMAAAFAHEEGALFPAISDDHAPAPVAAAIHDHHERFAASLRRLRPLAAEVRAAAGLTGDTMVVFAAMATVGRLVERHRRLEQWVLLCPGPDAEHRSAA
jgi:iron-sulfur cluster repair protein YtfE (RIC family)